MASSKLSYDPLCNSYTQPDPDIGGIGVITSIVAQSSFVLGISMYRSYLDVRYRVAGTHQTEMRITDRVLLMCSDVQGILGFSILIAALSQVHRISLYHSYIAWHLAGCVSLSHFSALHYLLDRSHRFIIPRLFIIFTSLGLFCAFGVIVWLRHLRSWADKPGLCYRQHPFTAASDVWVTHMTVSVVVLIIYPLVYAALKFRPFTIRLNAFVANRPSSRYWWIFCTCTAHSLVFILALSGIFSVYAASRPLLVGDDGEGQREQELWGFGQFIAILSVLAIAIESYKIYHEETMERPLRDRVLELEERLRTAYNQVPERQSLHLQRGV